MTVVPPSRSTRGARRPAREAITGLVVALGLLAALAALAAGCTAPPPGGEPGPPGSGATRVSIKALAFEPASLEIPAGSSVTWVSEDVAAHDVTADDGTFASGTLQQGDAFTWSFDQPGTWGYTCTLHPEMTGVVRVR